MGLFPLVLSQVKKVDCQRVAKVEREVWEVFFNFVFLMIVKLYPVTGKIENQLLDLFAGTFMVLPVFPLADFVAVISFTTGRTLKRESTF